MKIRLREIVPWNANLPVSTGKEENLFYFFDSILDDFFNTHPAQLARVRATNENSGFVPCVGFKENDTQFVYTFDVPGVEKKNDIELTVSESELVLKGSRVNKLENKEGERTYSETSYGSFERRVNINSPVDVDSVEAKLSAGQLVVTLKKKIDEASGPKRIKIS